MKRQMSLTPLIFLSAMNNYQMQKRRFSKEPIALFTTLTVLAFLLGACNTKEADLIDAETKRRIQLPPIVSLSEATTEMPSAELAKQFLRLLEKEDSDLALNLKICAANEYKGDQGDCYNHGYGDNECAVKRGFWKGTFAQHLRIAKIDLNHDQKPDYIFTGDSCSGFSGSPAFQSFVVLSGKAGKHIAARFTATHVQVMSETLGEGKFIVEGISSYNGQSLSIWKLSKGRYVEEQCMWRSREEDEKHGEFNRINCKPETSK